MGVSFFWKTTFVKNKSVIKTPTSLILKMLLQWGYNFDGVWSKIFLIGLFGLCHVFGCHIYSMMLLTSLPKFLFLSTSHLSARMFCIVLIILSACGVRDCYSARYALTFSEAVFCFAMQCAFIINVNMLRRDLIHSAQTFIGFPSLLLIFATLEPPQNWNPPSRRGILFQLGQSKIFKFPFYDIDPYHDKFSILHQQNTSSL